MEAMGIGLDPPVQDCLWQVELAWGWENMQPYHSLQHELQFRRFKGITIHAEMHGYQLTEGFSYDVVADDGMSFVRYAVDFANWTQTNCCTLCTRKIRRLVVKLGVV